MASTKLCLPGTACDHSIDWQPGSTETAGSRWLVVGDWALDVETGVTMDLRHGSECLWVVWCADGIHAAMLQAMKEGFCYRRISVCHVASGMQTASLNCDPTGKAIPRQGRAAQRDSAEMYVSCNAKAILFPESLQAVSLCRLPSLERVAQLVSPEVAGVMDEPPELYSMGWAAQGSLIAICWHWHSVATDGRHCVTVYAAPDGCLLHTLLVPVSGTDHWYDLGFSVCPDQPLAAVLGRNDDSDVVLVRLDSGMLQGLKRPMAMEDPWSKCGEVAIMWAPGGQHLMLQVDTARDIYDWAIFATSTGEWCGPQCGAKWMSEPPVWPSSGSICLFAGDSDTQGLDFTSNPPSHIRYFDCHSYKTDFAFDASDCAFVPGTQDLIQFEGDPYEGDPYVEEHSTSTAVHHWMRNYSTKITLHHEVPGFSMLLKGSLSANGIAWHPIMKPAIYALTEQRANAAVHLIDTRRHCRLITWTCKELERVLQQPFSGAPVLAAWSPDGKKLAVVNRAGTVILNFACGPVR